MEGSAPSNSRSTEQGSPKHQTYPSDTCIIPYMNPTLHQPANSRFGMTLPTNESGPSNLSRIEERDHTLVKGTEFPTGHETLAVALDQFHCFSKLPVELRLMIWRETFPGAREHDFRAMGFICDCPRMEAPRSPIALFVNQESRAEALKTYSRIEVKYPCHQCHQKAPITFFDYKLDTLLVYTALIKHGTLALIWKASIREMYIESLSRIQNLKITEWRFEHVSAEHVWQTDLRAMRGLKTVVFVRTNPKWNQHRFKNGVAAHYIQLHRQLFEKLQLADPTRSVPVVTVEDAYADLSEEEIMALEE